MSKKSWKKRDKTYYKELEQMVKDNIDDWIDYAGGGNMACNGRRRC